MNPHFIACESLADFREALSMISKPESNTSYVLLIEQTDLFKSKQDVWQNNPNKTQHSYVLASILATGAASLY